MTASKPGRPPGVREGRRFVQAAGLIFYLLAAQGLLAAGVGVHVYLSGGSARDLLLPLTGGLLAACYAVIGFHLRRYRIWARNFAFAFAAVSLFAFPVGTVLGSLIVLFIERGHRAGAFPERRSRSSVPLAAAEPEMPLLRFEPASISATVETAG